MKCAHTVTSSRTCKAAGFTLIELMVTIAIAAVLLMVAVPSFTTFKRNAELTSAANTLLAAVNAARGEALKRGKIAMVVPLNGTNWNSGVVAFVDADRTQTWSEAADITVTKTEPLPSYFTIDATGSNADTVAANPPYLMFNPSGYAVTKISSVGVAGSALQIYRNDLTGAPQWEQTRRLMVAPTGRVRTCKPVSAADPKCLMSTPS